MFVTWSSWVSAILGVAYVIGARCARPTLVVKTENCPYVYIYIYRLQCKFRYVLTIAQCAVVPNIGIQRISYVPNSISRLSRASCPVSRWSSYVAIAPQS